MRVPVLLIDAGGAYVFGVPEEGEEEGHASGPTPSTSAAMGGSNKGNKSNLKRGQHWRHQVTKKVHVILWIELHGEPLEPNIVIGTFSSQCSYIVREHVLITYLDWKKVLKELKDKVWTDIKKYF
jgi:hypothetical protein